ncbi:hypothetical protein G5V59_05695 [Nocardioides sp. W3-2-3]|uniref:hypothetical protein n=1 Tax=Nocardioides convexus TaxID=2712224 RepID=UPI0024182D68|nr:hypothetical protein [Nocardioides convexus]NGZ99919.1 hypothetical protein [Nocardioides convexus]
MWTGRAELRKALVALLLATTLPLAACSDDPPPPASTGGAYDDVAALMQRTLSQRAAALARHDRVLFRRTLDRSDAGLLDSQQTYFDNLAQAPGRQGCGSRSSRTPSPPSRAPRSVPAARSTGRRWSSACVCGAST